MKTTRSAGTRALRHAFAIGLWAFLLAALSSVASQTGAERIEVFAVGLLLFVLYATVDNDSGLSAEEIVIDEGRLSGLASNFEKTWQRPLQCN